MRTLIQTTDGPPLELICHCVTVTPDIPQDRVFENSLEEEAVKRQGLFDCHVHKIQHN